METHYQGENDAAPDGAARAAQKRLGVRVGHFYPWKAMTAWGPELFGDKWKAAPGHGAKPNVSVILYLTPQNVRMQDAVPASLRPNHGQRMADRRHVTFDGVPEINGSSVTSGDPTVKPDPEIGRALVERSAATLAKFIDWFRTT